MRIDIQPYGISIIPRYLVLVLCYINFVQQATSRDVDQLLGYLVVFALCISHHRQRSILDPLSWTLNTCGESTCFQPSSNLVESIDPVHLLTREFESFLPQRAESEALKDLYSSPSYRVMIVKTTEWAWVPCQPWRCVGSVQMGVRQQPYTRIEKNDVFELESGHACPSG